ncbi:DUF4145 domain-containing protein [Aliiroseovarius marinus]|uniref:DUF4145 domain-containing protein n=1 Tax=Aliiroseovarius marinus TaxID=2500159 RepID=UPI003D7EB85E
MATYILPKFGEIRFSCPHCGALAHQYWGATMVKWLKKDASPARWGIDELKKVYEEQKELDPKERFSDFEKLPEYIEAASGKIMASRHREDPYSHLIYQLDVSKCDSCEEIALWMGDKMVFPAVGPSVFANQDMSRDVRKLYDEAGAVFSTSPRSAAAMLRLALQVLLKELGGKGTNINDDIDYLSDNGLSPQLVKVMHSLRIIGNESVHPGQISVDDDPSIAEAMFRLINEVIEQLVTRPREQEELWLMLPENKRKPVEKKINKTEK